MGMILVRKDWDNIIVLYSTLKHSNKQLKVTYWLFQFLFIISLDFSSDLDSIRRFIAIWQLINFSINLNLPVEAYCESLRKLFLRFISHVEVSTLILLLLFSRHCFRFLLRFVEYFLSGLHSSPLLSDPLSNYVTGISIKSAHKSLTE